MDGDCKKIQDKAGREYWDAQWSNFTIPEIIDPGNTKPGGVIGRAQDRFLRKYLKENYHSSKGGGGAAECYWKLDVPIPFFFHI